MAQWVGYLVSIKCKDDVVYQGEISCATVKEITLRKTFCNGIPCFPNEVIVRGSEILDLTLINKVQSSSPQQRSTITIAKPIAKRAGRSQSTSEIINSTTKHTNLNGSHNKQSSRTIDFDSKINLNESITFKNTLTPSNNINNNNNNNSIIKREKTKGKWIKGWKDEECFGSPLDSKINKEFDFEKNLALFDKQAVWDEINNSQRPDVIKHIENRKPTKYRHDENIIATVPTTYRQITVPKQDFCEYVTDDGLIIPSISRSLRKRLWEAAEKAGLTWDKRVELLGRAAAEISIQLIGGGHRLNPHNTHQCPTVVVLCGPHKQGAMGINAARQLASHGIRTIVYSLSTEIIVIKKELSLYGLTKNRIIHSTNDLPNFADLIIVALCEDTENPKSYPDLSDWVNKNRAPILALDPPSVGTPGITPKFSLLPVLPLPHSYKNGKLYLCNLGFPVEIFNEVGIKYQSPFGPKFVIPLHPKDD